MNDTAIENILCHAPTPAAPAGLLKQLQAGIALPQRKSESKAVSNWQHPLRRWFPALAFSLFLLSCAIMIAVQGSWSANLKQQNETLQAKAANLQQLREQHAALEQALARQEELLQLQKDNLEVHQLQAEVAQLQSLTKQVRQLQDDNRRLAASLNAPAPANRNANFFDEAQQRAERIQCVNNLKQLGLAMRVWAGDNGDKYPASLVVMSNELSVAKILICPSDKARQPYATLSWNEFQDNMTSYDYRAQPDDERFPQCITAVCPIHHNYLLGDGSVQQINPAKFREVKQDGRWYLEPIDPASTP
jgi:hypothetical protein